MIWAIPLAMAAAGAIQGQQKREQEKRDRKAEAEIARWTPWTGMAPQRVQAGGGPLGGAVTGGLQGASFMQSMNAAGYGKGDSSSGEVADASTDSTAPMSQQTAMQQPNMSSEDPYVLSQRKYGQYGAPQQQQYTWNNMVASNTR